MPRITQIVLALMVGVVVACAASTDIPNEVEARAFLQSLVTAAQARDMDQLCKLANCSRDDIINPPNAPSTAPTVVTTWVLDPGTTPQGQQTSGGRVVLVCGHDDASQPYRSEILVIRANGALHTASFKYWLGMTVGSGASPTTPSGPPTSPTDCG
jgi:hypothetical protein